MTPCKFTFDDEKTYEGFSHGSTWNGFNNVAVTKDVLEKIIADMKGDETSGMNDETEESFRAIQPMENGLYSLGWGFATSIVES
jgi:hypothetical protein